MDIRVETEKEEIEIDRISSFFSVKKFQFVVQFQLKS